MDDHRRPNTFPIGYAMLLLFPLNAIIGLMVVQQVLRGPEAMTAGYILAIAAVGSALIVAGIGIYRLSRGDGKSQPALRWLVVLAILLGLSLFASM